MNPNHIFAAITKILINDEGLHLEPYPDSKGFWTIGIGRYVGPDLTKLRLSVKAVMQMFMEDVCSHWCDAVSIFGEDFLLKQTAARQCAILSLVFNLGKDKFLKFNETIPAIKGEEWERAADLLSKTKWASDVDPRQRENEGRDDRIIFMIRTGEYHAEYHLN